MRSSSGQPVSGMPSGFFLKVWPSATGSFALKPLEQESFSRSWQMTQ